MSYRDFLFQGLMNRGMVFDGDDGGGSGGDGGDDGGSGGEGGDGGDGGDGKDGKGKKPDPDDDDDDDDDDDGEDDKPIKLKEARKLRREAKARRIENEALKKRLDDSEKKSAEEKKALAVALGVVKADEDDPEAVKKALEDAKAEKTEADAKIRERDIRDSVRDACDDKDGNFNLVWKYVKDDLIASKVDPASDDFDAQVSKKVQAALKEEPVLKKGKTPGKSGSDLGGGRPSDGKAKSLEDAVGAHYSE